MSCEFLDMCMHCTLQWRAQQQPGRCVLLLLADDNIFFFLSRRRSAGHPLAVGLSGGGGYNFLVGVLFWLGKSTSTKSLPGPP